MPGFKQPIAEGHVSAQKNSKLNKTKNWLKNKWSLNGGWSPKAMVVFVLIFALVGVSVLLVTRADTGVGGLPTGSRELIAEYSIGMPHVVSENDFESSMPASLLLYADGLMLCGDLSDHKHLSSQDSKNPATYRSRQLTHAQRKRFFKQVVNTGIVRAAEYKQSYPFIMPAAVTDTITLNTTTGAIQAVRYPGDQNTAFNAVEGFIKSECALATEAYEPDRQIVQSIAATPDNTYASQAVEDLTPVLSEINTHLAQQLTTVTEVVNSVEVIGEQAQKVKTRIKRGAADVYSVDGKRVKIRRLSALPPYNVPEIKRKESKNKVSAAPSNAVRWLYVVPSGMSNNSNYQPYVNELANTIRDFYTRNTGKSISLSQVSVVNGRMTADQYKQCPNSLNSEQLAACRRNQSLAVYYNMQAEFKQQNVSTNIVFPFSTTDQCMGWGGPVANDEFANITNTTGFAVFSSTDCYWADGKNHVAAHEMGHTFGLGHTNCDRTVMDKGGCNGTPKFSDITLNRDQARLLANHSPFFIDTNPDPEGAIYTSDDDAAPYACSYQSGWALDQSDKSRSISVHVYVDGRFQNPVLTANQQQNDPNFRNIYGVADNHGWVWNVPSGLKDNKEHKVDFYAIDYPTNNEDNRHIGTRTIKCTQTVSDTTPPSAPGRLRLNGSATTTSVPLAWDSSSDNIGISSYDLTLRTPSGEVRTVNAGKANTYTMTGLQPNTRYSFSLVAKDAAGNVSPASNTLTVTTPQGQANTTPRATTAYKPIVTLQANRRCIDVEGGVRANPPNQTRIQLYDCFNTANQKWALFSDNTIRSEASGKCLDITGGSSRTNTNGTEVQLYDCFGTPNQQWTFNNNGSICSLAAGNKCLDARGPSDANGTQIQIWSYLNGSNQRWTF